MNISAILNAVPAGLRSPLLAEYNSIMQNYMERRWTSSELSGGKFCEIVYTILDGYAAGSYAATPNKPSNFVNACSLLESNTHVPRSFRILIPRMLPALYEVRNNRNVGHVGGDVDPNLMDSQLVVSMCGWIMGEIIRVFHNTSTSDAQKTVDFVTSRKIPFVWDTGKVKRVLKTAASLKDKILLLVGSSSSATKVGDLTNWIEHPNNGYLMKSVRQLHKDRLVELSKDEKEVELLPPGSLYIEGIIAKFGKQ